MLKCIIFDFDGVIIDNYELNFELSSKKVKNLTREEHRALFDGNIHIEKDKLKHRETEFNFAASFQEHKLTAKINPQIKDTLEKLSQKFTIGIISSAKEMGIKTFLQNNSLQSLFSFMYTYETHLLKDHKFKMVFDNFKLKPEECIYITDTVGDINEAQKAHVKSIAVTFGYHERERLQKAKPFRIISHITQLIPTIEEIQKLK